MLHFLCLRCCSPVFRAAGRLSCLTAGNSVTKDSAFAPPESILILAMAKRKPAKFSAAKAVKANARERVGQPKPSRVLAEKPRVERKAKHKTKLEEIIRREE
jgi:uncharacterized Zn finger protein (UPF0148 family)